MKKLEERLVNGVKSEFLGRESIVRRRVMLEKYVLGERGVESLEMIRNRVSCCE